MIEKPGRLTDEEFDVLKQHPTIGHTILTPLKHLAFVLPGVLQHHERIDGRGSPHGLAGEEISIIARILAMADSYDAMTSDRAFRPGMSASKATAILEDGRDTQWDPAVVETFLRRPEPNHGREKRIVATTRDLRGSSRFGAMPLSGNNARALEDSELAQWIACRCTLSEAARRDDQHSAPH